jgi:hypothetical protein
VEAGAVSVRLHHGGPQGAKPKTEVVADILTGIKGAGRKSGIVGSRLARLKIACYLSCIGGI